MTIGEFSSEPHEDDVSWGVVRRSGWPTMIAVRPEPWRFQRLAGVLDATRTIADTRLGVGEGDRLIAAMIEISDAKGDFSVGWNSALCRPEYEGIVDEALAREGEDDIIHFDAREEKSR
jgi:hypothetical protein